MLGLGELRERAEAKVFGRPAVISPDDSCGGSATNPEVGGRTFVAKGFCGAGEDVENGFEGLDVPIENGFADAELADGFAPKSVSPIPVFPTGFGADDTTAGADFSFGATLDIFVPRSALILPSLRLHVFLRHANT